MKPKTYVAICYVCKCHFLSTVKPTNIIADFCSENCYENCPPIIELDKIPKVEQENER